MNIADAILGFAAEQGQISTTEAIRYKKLWRRQDYAVDVFRHALRAALRLIDKRQVCTFYRGDWTIRVDYRQQAIVFTLTGEWVFPGANQAQITRIANEAGLTTLMESQELRTWAFEIPKEAA